MCTKGWIAPGETFLWLHGGRSQLFVRAKLPGPLSALAAAAFSAAAPPRRDPGSTKRQTKASKEMPGGPN